ncbi:SDR family NAD(P)-dependent oxidoreductase, partial [Wenjunlia tyrosinilytica]|uniref:SDR family NAD(P)-dependent oxidoreductase n=1 Tax=Wenjunlia tyrosinilytica TaxID=1544741 RepID=UPI001668AE21
MPTYAFDTKRYWIERKPTDPSVQAVRLFEPVFRHAALPAGPKGPAAGRWLVFTDGGGVVDAWAAHLLGLGESVVTVQAGPSFAELDRSSFAIRPESPEDFERLVRAVQERGAEGCTWNILYLWAVGVGVDLERDRLFALEAPVHLARALGLNRPTDPTRLAVVVQGVARAGGPPVTAPARALVLGPVKTLPLEYPALAACAFDVEGWEGEFELIVAELDASLPNSFVAYRDAVRLVEGIENTTSAPGEAPRLIREQGVYLITGGLGGIGSAIAAWLARNFRARLVLTGRTEVPAREQWAAIERDPAADKALRRAVATLRELEVLGAEVHLEAFDVADRVALANAVARAERRFGPIQGVVHAAGLAGGGLAQFRRVEEMRTVLAPKVDGTLAIAEVLGDRELDFFAVFSSTGALLGSLGQVDYCAANAFLDTWAESSDAPTNAVAIAWDAWRDLGMTSPERLPAVVLEAHAQDEWAGFSVAAGVSAFQRALRAGHNRVIVSNDSLPGRHDGGGRRRRDHPEAVSWAPERSSRAETEEVLLAIWRDLFGRAHIERDANFFELGGDSLLIIAAGQRIKQRLRVSLSVADLFKYPTVARLAEHLAPSDTKQQSTAELAAREVDDDTDVAVIGMAARLPGADNAEAFWANLVNGVESITSTDATPDPPASGQGRYVAVAGSPDGVDLFDPTFFGLTPREAELMDPQQRLLLMCSYEALENAGYDARSYPGRVAVYVGAAMSSYLLNNLLPHRGSTDIDPTVVGLGNDKDFAATQISYRLNLRGPSMSVSTACSTSLVAVAQGCRSLIAGDADIALVGGARVRVPERSGYWYQSGGINSPDGHCRAFDAEAAGTVFTSGAGVVVLKRLSDALRDGDSIRAVVRGSAVNN